MGRPKRNVVAAAEETSSPPSALTGTQSIARVIKAEGNSLYSCSLPDQNKLLVELPSRFRNTIWMKRGGYVLVDTKDADVRQNKLDGEIINVVRDEHLWRKELYWWDFRRRCEVRLLTLHLGLRNSRSPQHIPKTRTRRSRQLEGCHLLTLKSMNPNEPSLRHEIDRAQLIFLLAAPPPFGFTKSFLVPHHTLAIVVKITPTTTIELALVLGYTFQAHSWTANRAYCRIGCIPLRQRRNGVDHAI